MNLNEPPFEKDVLDGPVRSPLSQQPLSEKDFIQNKNPIAPFPFWVWLFLLTIVVSLLWGTWGWYEQNLQKFESHEPFLQVTNRNFSVFLWQFPNYLRANVKSKTGYLPDFQPDRANFSLSAAEDYVSAPPELLFLYHTWSRLLAGDFIARPIPPQEFKEFLEEVKEWNPDYWTQAPDAYKALMKDQVYQQLANMQALPETTLPRIVRQAFQGWKNYFKEGSQINELQPTLTQVQQFLVQHPNYDRPNWRNIAEVADQSVAGNDYLLVFQSPVLDASQPIAAEQLSTFLKVALFNAKEAQNSR